MSRYRVEKRAVETLLLLYDGKRLDGHLYLAPDSPRHSGPQTVADLMAEKDLMIPFRQKDGRFVLVGKASVAAVRVASTELKRGEFLERIPARLRLAGGHTLEGHFLAEKGAGDRLSDLLNTPDDWFRLEEPGAVHWISKRHIVTLEPEQS